MLNIFPRLFNTHSGKLLVRVGISGLFFVCGNLQVGCCSTASMASDAKRFVDSTVASKKVVIFSKTTCGYCSKAKQVLKLYIPTIVNADQYEEIEIDNRSDCEDIQVYFNQLTGGRSVPRVFVNGKFIGGCDDTMKLHKSGKLKDLLTSNL